MMPDMERWPLLLALGITMIVGLAAWLGTRRHRRPDARLAADALDPYRHWVQSAFLLVTGDCDYGHLSGAEARRMLAHWWDVYGPEEHRRVLVALARPRERDSAWDLLRFVLVSRLGVAAGFTPPELGWAELLPIARRLQAAYPTWRAMAQAYVHARRQWLGLPLDGSADDESMIHILDNLARLDDARWREQPYDTPLTLSDREHPHE